MDSGQPATNPFLSELLGLQQDGRQSISAPTNWTQATPLLEVETELDQIVATLAGSCTLAAGGEKGQWHFFVGSPGNGKSAAVGQLVRSLIKGGCRIVDDAGTEIGQLDQSAVPYSLKVYEPGKPFVSVRIVQDASVVRNPYAADVDPSRDLLETLKEAWEAGTSLIVCTNRGVLEKAFRDTSLQGESRGAPWHKAILRRLVDRDDTTPTITGTQLQVTSRKPVFKSIAWMATFLDKRSLILRGQNILDRLLQRAADPVRWTACAQCEVASLCPFKANRDWLADDQGRKLVVDAFRRAEVLSSQVIVFREALALISFIVAGCPRDYQGMAPCSWVRRLVERGDVTGLGTRRIHMCLYSTSYPRGLDVRALIRGRQEEALRELAGQLPPETSEGARRALTAAVSDAPPSTDVGVTRLLASTGIFARLDACCGPLPTEFCDDWDGNFRRIIGETGPLVSELDRACARVWEELEEVAQNFPTYAAEKIHWSLRRWSSQYTLHLGCLSRGRALAGEDIDKFSELLELLWKESSKRTTEEKRRYAELEGDIAQLLNRDMKEGPDAKVRLSENVSLHGKWVDQNLSPEVMASSAAGSLTVAVRFGDGGAHATIAAPMYLWLRQRARGTMDPRCIPSDDFLAEAMDAKSRAAARGMYAFEPKNVTLKVTTRKRAFEITRFDGDADVRAID